MILHVAHVFDLNRITLMFPFVVCFCKYYPMNLIKPFGRILQL